MGPKQREAKRAVVIVALLSAVLATACGGRHRTVDAPAEPEMPTLEESPDAGSKQIVAPAGRVASEFEAVAGSACACADQDCAEAELADFQQLVRKYRDTESDADATTRTSKAVQQLVDCLGKWGITKERIWHFLEEI